MAIKKVYDLAVKTREYTAQDGSKKANWQNIGSVMQGDDGSKFIMLSKWFNPAGVPDFSGKGGDSVLVSLFEPRAKDGQGTPTTGAPAQPRAAAPAGGAGAEGLDDDIPF